jgi:hypothetical protein
MVKKKSVGLRASKLTAIQQRYLLDLGPRKLGGSPSCVLHKSCAILFRPCPTCRSEGDRGADARLRSGDASNSGCQAGARSYNLRVARASDAGPGPRPARRAGRVRTTGPARHEGEGRRGARSANSVSTKPRAEHMKPATSSEGQEWRTRCGSGSWGGQRPSMGDYVTGTGARGRGERRRRVLMLATLASRSNEASQLSHPCRRSRDSSARSHLRCCRLSGQSSGDQGIVSADRISTRTLSQGE